MAMARAEKKQTSSTRVQAVRSALIDEMKRDEDVVILGEDIGVRGGVFLVTEGLIDMFGKDRVIDTPLAEAGIIGAAVGMACYGLKPVAEIQFIDFIFPGFDLLVSEAAKMRYRSAGQFSCPMVIRSPYGGGIFGRNSKGYDKSKVLLDSAGSIKGLEYLKHIIDESGTPVNAFLGHSGTSNYPAQFQQGRLAMVFDGPWSDQQW